MLLAIRSLPVAMDTKTRLPLAGGLRGTPAADVHHSVLNMFIAVHRRPATLDGKPRSHRAGFTCAAHVADVQHCIVIIFLAYATVLLPSAEKFGLFGQDSCVQRLLQTFNIPSSACGLLYTAVLLPTAAKLVFFLVFVLRATLPFDVHHAVLSMLLPVRSFPSALDTKTRFPLAEVP